LLANFKFLYTLMLGRRGGLMVSALDSSCPGSRRCRAHCVMFLGETLYSDIASLHRSEERVGFVQLHVLLTASFSVVD